MLSFSFDLFKKAKHGSFYPKQKVKAAKIGLHKKRVGLL